MSRKILFLSDDEEGEIDVTEVIDRYLLEAIKGEILFVATIEQLNKKVAELTKQAEDSQIAYYAEHTAHKDTMKQLQEALQNQAHIEKDLKLAEEEFQKVNKFYYQVLEVLQKLEQSDDHPEITEAIERAVSMGHVNTKKDFFQMEPTCFCSGCTRARVREQQALKQKKKNQKKKK